MGGILNGMAVGYTCIHFRYGGKRWEPSSAHCLASKRAQCREWAWFSVTASDNREVRRAGEEQWKVLK